MTPLWIEGSKSKLWMSQNICHSWGIKIRILLPCVSPWVPMDTHNICTLVRMSLSHKHTSTLLTLISSSFLWKSMHTCTHLIKYFLPKPSTHCSWAFWAAFGLHCQYNRSPSSFLNAPLSTDPVSPFQFQSMSFLPSVPILSLISKARASVFC